MSENIKFSRTFVIYAVCLPLAAYLGYILAGPMDFSGMALLAIVASVLGVPLMMRWFHPLTVLSWNTIFYLGFLPGQPPLWMAFAVSAFVVVLLNRCVDPNRRLLLEPSVAWPFLVLAIIIAGTAFLTGGIKMQSFGSDLTGGKRYFFIAAGILGYFVLANRRVPLQHAKLYAALFFLGGITAILSDVIYKAGTTFYGLYYIIPTGGAMYQAVGDQSMGGDAPVRIGGWMGTSQAVCLFLLARYGIKGILDFTRPWRFLGLIFFLFAGLLAGFRSFLVTLALIFMVSFFLEKLHRTIHAVWVLSIMVLLGVGLVLFATKLPISVQRAVSFLPVEVSPIASQGAGGSTEWRLQLWSYVLPEVSQHLLMGKGYAIDANDLFMAEQNALRSYGIAAEAAAVTGEYHSGPLSVIIPFGIWGALAFAWLMVAISRLLYRNFTHGDPALKTVNSALFACFIGKLIFFLLVFGSISSDLSTFAGLAGLSVSLNGESKERLYGQTTAEETYPAYV